jgi:hypothetical protein
MPDSTLLSTGALLLLMLFETVLLVKGTISLFPVMAVAEEGLFLLYMSVSSPPPPPPPSTDKVFK